MHPAHPFLLLAAIGLVGAAEFHIAPTGNDSDPGSADRPLRTFAAAAQLMNGGDTLVLHDGVFRDTLKLACKKHKGTKELPTRIIAAAGAKPVISGSDVVTGWVPQPDGIWVKNGWTANSQMVFVDGRPLVQIGATGAKNDHVRQIRGSATVDLVEGSFHYDVAAQRLSIKLPQGSDPGKAMVEAAVRPFLLTVDLFDGDQVAQHIDVKGIGFQHANSTIEDIWGSAVSVAYHSTISNCWFRWNDFAGISLAGGSVLVDCDVSDNGGLGINVRGHHHGWTVRGCTVDRNNWRNYAPGEHAGGLKCIPDGSGTVEFSQFRDNYGSGVWFDHCLTGKPIIVRQNRIIGNRGGDEEAGIKIEAVKNAVVTSNLLRGNSGNGVLVFGSNGTLILGNTIIDGGGIAAIQVGGVPRGTLTMTGTRIHGNIIAGVDTTYDLLIQPDSDVVKDNRSDGNLFWRGGGALQCSLGGTYTGNMGRMCTDLAAWTVASGHDSTSRMIDPLLVDDGRPGADSPAAAGFPASDALGADLEGRRREGTTWMIGAMAAASSMPGLPMNPGLALPGADVWFDDQLPAGTRTNVDQSAWKPENPNRAWRWSRQDPRPASGIHRTSLVSDGRVRLLALEEMPVMRLEPGDRLACTVWLHATKTPTEVMIQLTDGRHQSHWPETTRNWPFNLVFGAGAIAWGMQSNPVVVGTVPKAGSWVRLEIDAIANGLVGKDLTGIAIAIPNGVLYLDRVERLRQNLR